MSNLSALARHPLKSGAREVLTSAEITERGIPLDREFMVTKVTDGAERLCTQRDVGKEKLGQVKLIITPSELTLVAPGMENLKLPPVPDRLETRKVFVHSQLTEGIDQGDDAAAWLNRCLGDFRGAPLRLVRQNDAFVRRPNAAFVTQADAHTAFADGYPILLINDESLRKMLEYMRESGGMGSLPSLRDRVRGNLYVSELGEPFLEERIKRIRIGEVELELVKPCSRCSIPAINQSTGERDAEGRAFAAALGRYRRGDDLKLDTLFPALEKEELPKTFLGMNAVVVAGTGREIRLADPVEILEMRNPAS